MGHRRAVLVRIAWRCLVVYLVATAVFTVMTGKFYERYKTTPELAREHGRFVKSVRVEPPYIEWRGDRYPVLDAWIERKLSLKWHFLFAPWLVLDYHRFYFTTGRGMKTDSLLSGLDIDRTDSAIGYDGSLPAYPTGGFANDAYWRMDEPFPDKVRLQVLSKQAARR